MRKIISTFLILVLVIGINICKTGCEAQQKKVLTATITMVPKGFYGTWRVTSQIKDTDSPYTFKKSGLDIWNLSRTGDVITLCNMFNGARADITVSKADTNYIVFQKTGKYGDKILTDTVELNIKGDTFIGIDNLKLDTYQDGEIVKSERAIYTVKGEKIAGQIN